MSALKTCGKILLKNNLSISTAESLTGGMIASELVNISGISRCFSTGFVTYSDMAKASLLRVNPMTLRNFGAVSYETAREMAKNVRILTDSDIGVASTGFAGPTGGDETHPVGTVFISVAFMDHIVTRKFTFIGDRKAVRNKAKNAAFTLLMRVLKNDL